MFQRIIVFFILVTLLNCNTAIASAVGGSRFGDGTYPDKKQGFIDGFCQGIKNEDGMDCYNDEYVVTFTHVENWSYGVIKAPLQAKKHGKKPILFLMVDDLGANAEAMSEAKKWHDSTGLPMVFATIEKQIPISWI